MSYNYLNNKIEMEINQNKELKTEDNFNSVSIETNDENYKDKNIQNSNEISLYNLEKISQFDYLITIKRSPLFKIKYFKFGKTIHFYFCCSLKEKQYKLSEIPTPPFTLGPECKFNL